MRHALLVAVLAAAPATVVAQTPTPGLVLFTDGTGDLVRGPWISLAECESPAARVNLSWITQLAGGVSFPASARYAVYASNAMPAGTACCSPAAHRRHRGRLRRGRRRSAAAPARPRADKLAARPSGALPIWRPPGAARPAAPENARAFGRVPRLPRWRSGCRIALP